MIIGAAKIQLRLSDFEKFIGDRSVILEEMKKYYSGVTLDLEARDEQ